MKSKVASSRVHVKSLHLIRHLMHQSSLAAVFNQQQNDENSNGDISGYAGILRSSLCCALQSNIHNEREAAMLLMLEMIDNDGVGKFIRLEQ